jgi:hypothetical protein
MVVLISYGLCQITVLQLHISLVQKESTCSLENTQGKMLSHQILKILLPLYLTIEHGVLSRILKIFFGLCNPHVSLPSIAVVPILSRKFVSSVEGFTNYNLFIPLHGLYPSWH